MQIAGLDPVVDLPVGKRRLEGKSILPIFKGESFQRGEPLNWEWLGSTSILDGDWKAVQLVSYFDDFRRKLYNLADDPTEVNDLAAHRQGCLSRATRIGRCRQRARVEGK